MDHSVWLNLAVEFVIWFLLILIPPNKYEQSYILNKRKKILRFNLSKIILIPPCMCMAKIYSNHVYALHCLCTHVSFLYAKGIQII